MHFYTPYDKGPSMPEVNSGEILVEKAGYIPAEIQVRQLIEAGRRLNEYRSNLYDFAPDQPDDDDLPIPHRSKGFDLADASAIKKDMEARFNEEKRIQKDKKAKEAKKATDKPSSPKEPDAKTEDVT